MDDTRAPLSVKLSKLSMGCGLRALAVQPTYLGIRWAVVCTLACVGTRYLLVQVHMVQPSHAHLGQHAHKPSDPEFVPSDQQGHNLQPRRTIQRNTSHANGILCWC